MGTELVCLFANRECVENFRNVTLKTVLLNTEKSFQGVKLNTG